MMKNIKKKLTIFIVVFAMILPLSLASVFATGEEFQYNLNYVLSEDKTYATITLALLPTTDINYTSITDVHNNEEHLNSTNETITRDYQVTSNKDYNLQIKYTKQSGDEQSQNLKLTVIGIENIQSRNTVQPIPDSACTISDDGTLQSVDFNQLTNKENIVIPETITKNGIPITVLAIDNWLFSNNQSIKTVTIPGTVTNIGSSSFSSCFKLESIEMPDSVTSVGDSAFYHCTSLKRVRLSEKLAYTRGSMFDGCTSLTEIRIPKSLKTIPGGCQYSTFRGCTQLENVIIYDSMENIESGAFSGCTSLNKVMILSEKDDYDNHMNDLIQSIREDNQQVITKYLGHTLLEVRQEKVSSYGEKVYDLDDLIYTPTVYKYEDDGVTKSVSHDFDLPSEYTLVKKSKSNDTRLDVANKKLYIGANENSIMTLSATYDGNTVSTQIEATPIVLESIAVKVNPHQLEYRDGDIFNPEGLVITLTYNSGDTKDVSYQDEKGNFTFDLSKLKTGDKNVKVTYQGKEATIDIKVIRQPILADADKNVIEGIKESYSKDATVSFQAKGDQQDNLDPVKGDTRYIPLHWKVNETENFNKDNKATLLASSTGKQTLIVTFQLEEYDGSKWIAKGTDIKEKTFTVDETVHIDLPETPVNDKNIPIKDKDIYFHLNRTENGIIYDENGNRVDQYGNIIQTSDETSLLVYLGMIALSGCAIIMIRKKYYK